MHEFISKNNPLVKHLTKLVKDASYRYKCKSCVITGSTLINEILTLTPIKILLDLQENSLKAEKKFLADLSILKKITNMASISGPVAEVTLPEFVDISNKKKIAILDEISDPGNLGTILRSALAFGIQGVHLTKNCCDPFNDKVNRAAKGANFILPISYEPYTSLKTSNFHLLLADMEGTDSKKITLPKSPIALVLSNESRGLNPKWEGEKIAISMQEHSESLNVSIAGSILFYELANHF